MRKRIDDSLSCRIHRNLRNLFSLQASIKFNPPVHRVNDVLRRLFGKIQYGTGIPTDICKGQPFIRSKFSHLQLIHSGFNEECRTGIQKPFAITQFQLAQYYRWRFIVKADPANLPCPFQLGLKYPLININNPIFCFLTFPGIHRIIAPAQHLLIHRLFHNQIFIRDTDLRNIVSEIWLLCSGEADKYHIPPLKRLPGDPG